MKEYHPAKFWESRYQKFDITTSGHADLPYDYNAWLYRMKRDKILQSLHGNMSNIQDKNVLELGCGTGAYLDLWKNLNVKSITGADISPSSVTNLQKQYPEYNFFCQDISDDRVLNLLGEKKYEIVTAIGVLVHIVNDDDMRSSLQNIARLVTDDGLVLISDYMLSGVQSDKNYGYMKFRNLSVFEKNLYDVGLELTAVIPFYYFMINPIDTPSQFEEIFLKRSYSILKYFIRKYPSLSGRLLYYVDTIITAMLSDGPSEELYVCVKVSK